MNQNEPRRPQPGDTGYSPVPRSEHSAPTRLPLQRRPESPATPASTELAALRRVEAKLRRGGANLPAPAAQGTIESAIATGLSMALALVDDEITVLTRDAEMAAATAVMTPSTLQAWEQRRADLRDQVTSSRETPHHTGVRADEIAQLLDDLESVGAKATGEMIGICGQAAAVINALLTGLSVEQLA